MSKRVLFLERLIAKAPAKRSVFRASANYVSKMHFVRDFPQKLELQVVKTKLSCEASLL